MINRSLLERVLERTMATGADFAEIFAEKTRSSVISYVNSKIDSISDNTISGVGIRAFLGTKTVFASTTDISEIGLMNCAASVADAIGTNCQEKHIVLTERINPNIHPIRIVPSDSLIGLKTELLHTGCQTAKEYDKRIVQVEGSLMNRDRDILIANSDGLFTTDRCVSTRMAVNAVASNGHENQSGGHSPGRLMGLEFFEEHIEDFKNSFESVVWHLDSPVADPSTMAIFLICKEASKHLKVVLSGEGADELFGGYRIYKEQIYSSKIFALPGFLKSFLAYLGRILPENVKGRAFLIRGTTPLDKRYVGNAFVFNEEQKKPILRNYDENIHFSDIVKPVYDRAKELSLTPMLQMQYVDMNTWIRGDILTKGDRLSMAHSLEVRVPFLDKEVFKFASTLTDKDKLSHKTTKYILRYTFKDLVDEATFMRPKWGYPVPVRKWLKNELYPWAKDIIENSTADDYIVKEEALKLLEAHRDGTADNYRKLWVILVFITWYRLYVTDINNSIKKYITD